MESSAYNLDDHFILQLFLCYSACVFFFLNLFCFIFIFIRTEKLDTVMVISFHLCLKNNHDDDDI